MMWLDAKYLFIANIVHKVIERATIKKPIPLWQWKRSRAPYCYAHEYAEEFGQHFSIGNISAEHERIWRESPFFPNIPPVEAFYGEAAEDDWQGVYDSYNCERRRKEALRRKKHKKNYDQYYNGVRRDRRRRRKAEALQARQEYWEQRRESSNRILACK